MSDVNCKISIVNFQISNDNLWMSNDKCQILNIKWQMLNIKCQMSNAECDKYIRIFKYSNIFDPNIYSNIRSYHFLDANIFGYLFVNGGQWQFEIFPKKHPLQNVTILGMLNTSLHHLGSALFFWGGVASFWDFALHFFPSNFQLFPFLECFPKKAGTGLLVFLFFPTLLSMFIKY